MSCSWSWSGVGRAAAILGVNKRSNENVLIEIGAAMALYGDKFVEEGVKLPSNLQGLYECLYKGSGLDMSATMKLLEAFSEF